MARRRLFSGSRGTRDTSSRPPARGRARRKAAPRRTSAATPTPSTCVPCVKRSQAAPASPARSSVAVSSSFTSARTAPARAQRGPDRRPGADLPASERHHLQEKRRGARERPCGRDGDPIGGRKEQVEAKGAHPEGEDVQEEAKRDDPGVRGGEVWKEVC